MNSKLSHSSTNNDTSTMTPDTSTSTTNNNNPKYKNISPSLFPLTPQEESLLNFYTTIQTYEKMAASKAARVAQERLMKKQRLLEESKRMEEEEGNDGVVGDGVDEEDHDEDMGQSNIKMEDGTPSSSSRKRGKKRKTNASKQQQDGTNDDGMMHTNIKMENDEDSSFDGDYNDTLLSSSTPSKKTNAVDKKLAQIRTDIENKQYENIKEEEQRQQLLQDGDTFGTTTLIGRKTKRKTATSDSTGYTGMFGEDDLTSTTNPSSNPAAPAASLISNMHGVSTPPHDFSKKLKMSRVTGTQLYPPNNIQTVQTWTPPMHACAPDEGCLEMSLKDFNFNDASMGQGNNTVAIKCMAPSESKRFSINIAALNHTNYYNILFHCNPRQFEKGGLLVCNDKQEGTWGAGINVPLSTIPMIFTKTVTIIIQINGDGFDVFIENQHCARLEHRTTLSSGMEDLMLQFPSTDDYGKVENWSVYKVWWGHKKSMVGDLSNVAGVNTYNSLHTKKLFISGLPKIYTDSEVDIRRAELERAFHKYGGAMGVLATIPTNATYAFVEVETERQADLALAELGNKYRMNRARRSRHEALMEERERNVAAAGMVGEGMKESKEWE